MLISEWKVEIDMFVYLLSLYFHFKEDDLCQALVDALRRGYIDFIELLMDHGTSLKQLTLNNLEQLYAHSDV